MVSLEHVAITDENLDKAIDFYSDVFGFSILKMKKKSELGITYSLLQIDNLRIELIEPLTKKISDKKKIEKNQDLVTKLCDRKGLNHLSIRVKNLNEITAKLKKKGAKKVAELGSKESSKLIFYADTEGNMIELIQST